MLPRLTRQWSHLSRQGGGVGQRGGEGEKQLEQDRRVHPHPHPPPGRGPREDRAHPRRAAARPARRPDRRPHRLHQRRQVDPVQPPHPRRHAGREPPLRHPRRQAPARRAKESGRRPDVVSSPTRSASSASSPTTSSPPSAAPWERSPRPTSCSTSSTAAIRAGASRKKWPRQVMDELGVDRARVIKVFNKSDLVPADEPRTGDASGSRPRTARGHPGRSRPRWRSAWPRAPRTGRASGRVFAEHPSV